MSLQFSFEEESDDVVCEISEGVVRDEVLWRRLQLNCLLPGEN
jgi:hypothetical protein